MRRIKPPPQQAPGKVHPGNPLQTGDVDEEKKRLRNVSKLHKERSKFMGKLDDSRITRAALEMYAASLIQKMYRGYTMRCKLPLGPIMKCIRRMSKKWNHESDRSDVQSKYSMKMDQLLGLKVKDGARTVFTRYETIRKELLDIYRQDNIVLNSAEVLISRRYSFDLRAINAYLDHLATIQKSYETAMALVTAVNPSLIKSGSEFRKKYSELRFKSASTIQNAFRGFIRRRCLRKRDFEAGRVIRMKAVVAIQSMSRKVSAKARVDNIKERNKINLTRKKATIIQKHIRALFARRRVRKRRYNLRWISARMIQGWFRYKKEKIKESRIKEIVLQQKYFLGAQGMQCLVRRKIARARVNRIRLRLLYLFIYRSATTIETLVRKFLSRRRVYLIKMANMRAKTRRELDKDSEMDSQKAAMREAADKLEKETADAFYQAKVGGVAELEALFDANAENKSDSEGNTLLHIAAIHNQVEVLQKCFEWDLEFEKRNAAGLTPLMVAMNSGSVDVASTILQPPMKFKLDRFNPTDSAFMWYAALSNMSPQRCRLLGRDPTDDTVLKLLQSNSLPVTGKHENFANGGPLLAACALGDVATFRYMLKNKAPIEQVDDDGNRPLHFAVQSSISIVKLILGLDSSAGILVPDSQRAHMLLAANSSGKDCSLLAAITGQTNILQFCLSTCESNREALSEAKKIEKPITWSMDNVKEAMMLAETGNQECLKHILERGFDVMSAVQESGINLAMQACRYGHIPIIDMLLDMKVDFMAVDLQGKTAVHYAAMCNRDGIVAHLLSHRNAHDCGMSQMSVTVQDNDGATPIHVAAMHKVLVEIDLLASHGLEIALNTKDENGMTPLLIACRQHHFEIVEYFLKLDLVDVKVTDDHNHNALWHLSHSTDNRPLASELRAKLGLEGKQSKTDRQQNAERLATDISVFTSLIKAGCPLYSSSTVTAEEILSTPIAGVRDPSKMSGIPGEDRSLYDPGDLIVQDMSLTLLKGLPDYLSRGDSWRLLLSSLRYDEGTNKSLISIFDGGLAVVISGADEIRKRGINNNPTISQLDDGVTFGGLSVAGWCIKLRNHAALNLLRKNKYDMSKPADVAGDSALHLVARFGTASMVDIALQSDDVRIEQLNKNNNTPLMEAAKSDNFRVARRLIACHASARRGLGGKYCAWLLVLARRQEETHRSLQTGRIGEDDAIYYPAPEPSWYEDAMRTTVTAANADNHI